MAFHEFSFLLKLELIRSTEQYFSSLKFLTKRTPNVIHTMLNIPILKINIIQNRQLLEHLTNFVFGIDLLQKNCASKCGKALAQHFRIISIEVYFFYLIDYILDTLIFIHISCKQCTDIYVVLSIYE